MGINVFPQPSSAQSKITQTITTSGNWTVPNGVTSVDVTCIGAAAAIGGAGAVVKGTVNTSSLQGTNITVTVGAAPLPAVNGKGGDTSFGTHMTAGGGFAGDTANAYGFAAPSGTTFISGTTIPATSVLRPFISSYGGRDNYQQNVSYNSTIGLYMTGGAYVSPDTGSATAAYYTSPDLITWTRRTNNLTNYASTIIKVYSANNRFFTTYRGPSGEGYFESSTDGINWSSPLNVYPNGQNSSAVLDIMYSSTSTKYYFLDRWLSNNSRGIISSVTAANVTTTDTNLEQSRNTGNGLEASGFITNGSNLGIVFVLDYSTSTSVYSLFNGTTWASYANATALSATFNTTVYPTSGAWDGSKFTMVDSTGNLFTTTNLTTWTAAGVNVSGLFIQGYSGGYYYGNIGSFYAYSTNGTTWTKTSIYLTNTPSANSGGYTYVQNGTNLVSVANTTLTGLIETFNIASPNTTIAPGFLGKSVSSSPMILSHGGAGGNGSFAYTWNGSTQGSIALDSPGVDGYGIVTSSSVLAPKSYGSTNGGAGNSGAVILTWLQ